MAEEGLTVIHGEVEARWFSAGIPDKHIALSAVCFLAGRSPVGGCVSEVAYKVTSTEDSSYMQIYLAARQAPQLDLVDPFAPGIVSYFRAYVEGSKDIHSLLSRN